MKKLPTHILHEGKELYLSASRREDSVYQIQLGEETLEVLARDLGDEGFAFQMPDGSLHRAQVASSGDGVQVRVDGQSYVFKSAERVAGHEEEQSDPTRLVAPMTGTISMLLVELGSKVEEDQDLVVLTAMKMEHHLKAGSSGVVAEILASPGETVDSGSLLLRIDNGAES